VRGDQPYVPLELSLAAWGGVSLVVYAVDCMPYMQPAVCASVVLQITFGVHAAATSVHHPADAPSPRRLFEVADADTEGGAEGGDYYPIDAAENDRRRRHTDATTDGVGVGDDRDRPDADDLYAAQL